MTPPALSPKLFGVILSKHVILSLKFQQGPLKDKTFKHYTFNIIITPKNIILLIVSWYQVSSLCSHPSNCLIIIFYIFFESQSKYLIYD